MIDKETGLTDRQKRFCDEYLIDLNGTRAYRTVYNCKTDNAAAVRASETLRNIKISEYISVRQKPIQDKINLTAEFVINGIKEIAMNESAKHSDKLKAFELLGKYKELALFSEKLTLKIEHDDFIQNVQEQIK